MFQPGDRVVVPDDDSGEVVFVRRGEQSEGVEVESPATDTGTRIADVGWVRYANGDEQAWPYASIKPA